MTYKKCKKAKTFQLQILEYKSNIDCCLYKEAVVAISINVSSNGLIDIHKLLTASYQDSHLISKIFLFLKLDDPILTEIVSKYQLFFQNY